MLLNLGLPLAPPLGELAKPKALTERVSLFTKKAATHRSVQQLLYYKVLLLHLLCQKCRRHVHRLELGGIGLAVRSSVSRPTLPVTSPAAMMGTAHSSARGEPSQGSNAFSGLPSLW